jgi:hypothetical protein
MKTSVTQMFNTYLKIWLILWVVGLPLVHIHPETDHAHGMSGHVHGGTFHTVLSSKPICAYEDHRHHHESFLPGEPFETPDSSSHPPHGLEHSVYGFSVLNSSIDPIIEGNVSYFASNDLAASAIETPTLSWSCVSSITIFSLPETPASILIKTFSPRGSPTLSV